MHRPKTTEDLYAFMHAMVMTRSRIITSYRTIHRPYLRRKTWLIICHDSMDECFLEAPMTERRFWIPKYADKHTP